MKSVALILMLLAGSGFGQEVVPYRHRGGGSTFSYDNMTGYTNTALVNSLNGGVFGTLDPWSSSYLDRANYYGVLVFDDLASYSDTSSLNGLNDGQWNNQLYVARNNWFPGIAYDDMTLYTDGTDLGGLNGGANNSSPLGVVWTSSYLHFIIGPPTNTIVLFGHSVTFYVTSGGSPTAYQWYKHGSPIGGATSSSYTIGSAVLSDYSDYNVRVTLGGNTDTSTSAQLVTVTTTTVSNWVNQVVVNGGGLMSSNTIWNVDQFWNGLVTDSLTSSMVIVNPVVPDSLIAAQTPLVAGPGYTLWINNSFVSADLTVNGLKGNASNKFLDTGATPAATWSPVTSAGVVIYTYDGPGDASGGDFGDWNGTLGVILFTHYSDGTLYAYNGTIAGNLIHLTSSGNGYYSDQRVLAIDHRLYFANSGTAHAQIGATDATSFSSAQDNHNMLFISEGLNGANSQPTDNRDSFVACTTGLNSTQDSNLYNRVQTLRTGLGGGFR